MIDVPENVSLVCRLSEASYEMLTAVPCMEAESLKQDLVVAKSAVKISQELPAHGGRAGVVVVHVGLK